MDKLGDYAKYYEERTEYITMENVSCRSVNGNLDDLYDRLAIVKPTHILINSSDSSETNLDLLVLLIKYIRYCIVFAC